jgi:hypothetical protein
MRKITDHELTPNLRQDVQQALGDLHRTLPAKVAEDWLDDARRGSELLDDHLRDPWNSPG